MRIDCIPRPRPFAHLPARIIERLRPRCLGHDPGRLSREALRAPAGSYYRAIAAALRVTLGAIERNVMASKHATRARGMNPAGRAGRPIPKGALRSRAPAGSYYRAIAAALRVTLGA